MVYTGMPRAVIQGEVHTSGRDKAAVQEQLSAVDAVIRESMDDQWENSTHPLYLLMFLGWALFDNTIRCLYASDEPLFAAASNQGIDTYRMNISIKDWTERISGLKLGVLLGVVPVLTYSMIQGLPTWLQLGSAPLLFILLFFLYTAIFTIPERDAMMVDTIQTITDEHGYDTVLLSVGDGHVPGIRKRLEADGWDVETHRSTSLFGQMIRPYVDILHRTPS